MYKNAIYTILRNEPLTPLVWRMVLEGDTEWITRPGQFVNIALEGKFLRRPISVSDYDEKTITLIYKVVGEGTKQMSGMQADFGNSIRLRLWLRPRDMRVTLSW